MNATVKIEGAYNREVIAKILENAAAEIRRDPEFKWSEASGSTCSYHKVTVEDDKENEEEA